MKKLLWIIPIILFYSCQNSSFKNPNLSDKVKIDTVIKGTYGDTSYYFFVKKMIDTLLIEEHHKFFELTGQRKGLDIKDYFYDSTTGKLRYFYCSMPWIYKDETEHSYSWCNKYGECLISIDTIFSNNKIKEIEYCCYEERQFEDSQLLFEFKKEFKSNRVFRIQIDDFEMHTWYQQENGNFYELETDVPAKYAEWNSSSKYTFGRAMERFCESFALAQLRIDKGYVDLAKEQNNIDLKEIFKNLF